MQSGLFIHTITGGDGVGRKMKNEIPSEYFTYINRNVNGGHLRDNLMFADLPDLFGTNIRFSDCILSDFLL